MTAAELARAAEELGIDVIGAAPAEAYDETEQHILERRERGLFAGMKFTMARPEVSCHPELLLDGEARTVVSAALCYWADAPDPAPGEGRLPRYAWIDHYALLRERLDALGRLLGGRYRVLVDENQHVDREGARRAGVGFYGKNTMMITREHGSWVVLGTLVTDVEIEPTPPLDLDCGRCRLCIDACPTGALDEPGVLDANRCLSFWTQAPAPVPEAYREELGASVYGCDICQDVCPWNRGIEKRRAGRPLAGGRDAERLARSTGSRATGRSSSTRSTASTSRATTRGGCGGTRSPRSATPACGGRAAARRGVGGERRPDARRDGRPGRSSGSRSGRDERRPERPRRPRARDPQPRRRARRDRRRPIPTPTRRAGRGCSSSPRQRVASIERLLVEAPTASLRIERLDAGRLALDAVETARARRAGCASSPDVEDGLVVDGDPERLRQALDNLIGNAIGHSPAGGAVTVTATRERRRRSSSRSPTRETAFRPPTSSACSSRASG